MPPYSWLIRCFCDSVFLLSSQYITKTLGATKFRESMNEHEVDLGTLSLLNRVCNDNVPKSNSCLGLLRLDVINDAPHLSFDFDALISTIAQINVVWINQTGNRDLFIILSCIEPDITFFN